MRKLGIIVLTLVLAFTFAACGGGGGGGGGSQPAGRDYSTGTFSVKIPNNWLEGPFYVFGSEEVDPDVLGIHKGITEITGMPSTPYIQINFFAEGKGFGNNLDRSMYENVVELSPMEFGNYTWEGFSAESFGREFTILWTEAGEHNLQATLWLKMGDQEASIDDADVRAIISSIEPD